MAGDDEPSKNPFIRWKQHVDSHISSALQNIVGLPSAVSRNINNRTWPEVEEARRKELDRQQQNQEGTQKQPLPSATDSDQKTAAETRPASLTSTVTDPTPSGWTVSFLSPRDHDHCLRTFYGSNSSSSGAGSVPNSSDGSHSNDPDSWTTWPDWVQQARWHSFAAYSPYSPLNLRNMPQPRPLDLPTGQQSNLTFEDAFEDLLAVACGRELATIQEKTDMRKVLRNMFPTGEPAFYWVRRLQAQGLLNGYFPRADQLRRELEERLDADSSEEDRQRQKELDEKRGRMWKWVWSRHHPMSGSREGLNKPDPADAKSFEEWDNEDWVKEMDAILSQAAKDVRSELNNNGHIFGELDRIFKAVGKMGEAFSGFGEESPSSSAKKEIQMKAAEPTKPIDTQEEETEEGYYSALAEASGSTSASASTSTGTGASNSVGTLEKISKNDGTLNAQATASSDNKNNATATANHNKSKGPFQNSTTSESVDHTTGIRTVKTTEEKVDRHGNRTLRTEIKQLNSDGEEISRRTSYSKTMSASWSWSSGPENDSGDDGWFHRKPADDVKEGKTGWFWK